mgnify:CR=1 FL=1
MSNSEWLKEYYSRISQEYRFSLNRKDTLTYWALTAMFVMIAAYVELLRVKEFSFWRMSLLAGAICLSLRFFVHSCIAYAYLKKWRFLLEQIEKHWMTGKPSLSEIQNNINKYHHTPRTTVTRWYLVRSQLKAGFLLVFLIPSLLIMFEIINFPQTPYKFIPFVAILIYLIYECLQFVSYEHTEKA